MMVHMSKEQAFTVSLRHIVNSDGIARILVAPGKYTDEVRRDIAMNLAAHLLGNGTGDVPKDVPDIVNTVISTDEWAQMRDAALKNDLMPGFILGTVLRSLFSLPDGSGNDDLRNDMKRSWKKISSFIGTMDIIRSLGPIGGFNYSIRNAYSELMTYVPRYRNLIERNDDLESIANCMKFMDSELSGRALPAGRRLNDILVIVDTSESMYGEPELISKGFVLALTKHMLVRDTEVNVIFFSSDLPVLRPSDGRDMIEMLSFRGSDGRPFAEAVKMLLERMKQRTLHGADVILVSKGKGVMNDPKITRDWDAYRHSNGIRVITAVAGGDSACGLTELSDHIAIFNDATIHGEGTEFAKTIEFLLSGRGHAPK